MGAEQLLSRGSIRSWHLRLYHHYTTPILSPQCCNVQENRKWKMEDLSNCGVWIVPNCYVIFCILVMISVVLHNPRSKILHIDRCWLPTLAQDQPTWIQIR